MSLLTGFWSGHHTPSREDWDQPQYFFPTYENDNLLFGLEDPEAGEVVEVTPEEVNDLGESILAKEEVRKELTGVRRGGSRRGRGGPRQKTELLLMGTTPVAIHFSDSLHESCSI